MIQRKPQEFKIECLQGLRRLFPEHAQPFYAGFGNRDTDTISYQAINIPESRIFIINPEGLSPPTQPHLSSRARTGLMDAVMECKGCWGRGQG